MGRFGEWVAITPDEAAALLNALPYRDAAVEPLVNSILDNVHERPDDSWLVMDKVWEPIHRCLTCDRSDGVDFDAGDFPLKFCVVGGTQLTFDHRYFTSFLVLPDEVRAAANALKLVNRKMFHDNFFSLTPYFHEIDEDVFEWVWEHFVLLPPLFIRAAEKKLAILCRIEQD